MKVPPFALGRPLFVLAVATGLLAGCGGGGSSGGAAFVTEASPYLTYAETMPVGALPGSNAVLMSVNGALSISDAAFGTVNLVPDGQGGYKSSPPFTEIVVSGAVDQPVIGLCQKNAAGFVDSKFLLLPQRAVRVTNAADLAGVNFSVATGAIAGCDPTNTAFSFKFKADGSLENESVDLDGDPEINNYSPAETAQLLNSTLSDGEASIAIRVYKAADGRFLLIGETMDLDHPGATEYTWLWSR